MAISFHFETKTKLIQRRLLKLFLADIIVKEKGNIGNLSFVFCSDPFLLDINIKHLNHNYFTDIITFHFKNEESKLTDGEIYISIDRVTDNSNKYKTTFEDELNRVIFHGVLHLCGYKDKSRAEKEQMRKKEDFYLKRYKSFVPRGTRQFSSTWNT